MSDFIAYYRVSPGGRRKSKKLLQGLDDDEQRNEVLSLQSQQNDVKRYLSTQPGAVLVQEFTEIESGKRHENRTQLKTAFAACQQRRAVLIIAKLDRLARDVHFISGLMKSKVEFVAVDLPAATPLTIHILAAVAQDERERISGRIKSALSVLKARGVVLGNRDMAAMREKARLVNQKGKNSKVHPADKMLIKELKRQGCGLTDIAKRLNDGGSRAPKGGMWGVSSVRSQLR